MAQNGLWNLAGEKMLQDRGVLLKKEGDVVREYKAMHEEKFLSSWLREDVDGIEEGRTERKRLERRKVGVVRRMVEREEEKTVVVKRRCDNLVVGDAVEEFSHVEDSDGCGISWDDLLCDRCDLSWWVPEVSSSALVGTDVLDSSSSLVVMS